MTQDHKSHITSKHPADSVLADYLDNLLSHENRKSVEAHLAACDECLDKIASAYQTVRSLNKNMLSNNAGLVC